MHHGKDVNFVVVFAVSHDVRVWADDQFARIRYATHPADVRLICKCSGLMAYAGNYLSRSFWILFGNISLDRPQIRQCRSQPAYGHDLSLCKKSFNLVIAGELAALSGKHTLFQYLDVVAVCGQIARQCFVNNVGFCAVSFFGQLMKLPLHSLFNNQGWHFELLLMVAAEAH